MDTEAIHVQFEPSILDKVLTEWQLCCPDLAVFALLPESEKNNVPGLQSVCREKGISLYGGIFPALVTDTGFSSEGAWLFPFGNKPYAKLIPDLAGSEEEAAEQITSLIQKVLLQHAETPVKYRLFMIFDAMIPNISSILDQLYLRLSNRVFYGGVNAGSESFKPTPCLFDTSKVIGNGVLIFLLPTEFPFCLEHAYPAPAHMMISTSSEGNCINSIDWRSAFDVYQEIIGNEYNIELTQDNFYHYAVHYPFGILRADGEVVVRIPVSLTDQGSIHCVGEVPVNAMLALLCAPAFDKLRCVERLILRLNHEVNKESKTLMTFYCAGRRMHLGDSAINEVKSLHRESGFAQLAGALSLGEIGSSESEYPFFHNAALVCHPWI